ncbi:MAG: DUF4422 domain-containing protein [Pseudobutyrivibrio sp.]|nr:DUF4422 domain-containing protein [Pseudobutyrivibrio sp.]
MDIKIIIAMHKAAQVPEYGVYLPLQVGAAGKKGIRVSDCPGASAYAKHPETAAIARDDDGDNISAKNPFYCELTGLYYAWKNLDDDYIGLVHYRRYFSLKTKAFMKKKGLFNSVLSEDEAAALLTRADIVVPRKRRYYIESLYSHYANTLDGSHLDIARGIVGKHYPDFMPYVEKAYKQTWGYMFNMAIMPRDLLDEYCNWLFDILGRLEQQVDVADLDSFHARLFGRVSEILFNVWVLKKMDDGMSVVECPVIDMEPINWPKKILGFLQAKFFGKKYTKSM